MKITFLYNTYASHTGGQVYEKEVFDILRDSNRCEVERIVNPQRRGWKKIFSPVMNCFKYWSLKDQDIIFINSSHAVYFIPLAFILRIIGDVKVYVFHHHYLFQQFTGFKRAMYMIAEYLILTISNRIIAPSPYIVDLNKKYFKTKTLFWPIPFDDLDLNLVPHPCPGRLLYVGTIEERKGITYLIEAMKWLQSNSQIHYSLRVIGKVVSGAYYDKLRKEIDENGLDVTFLGYVNDEEKKSIFSESDIFVFPSQLEGYGMVLWEAMSYGLPIVCFNNSAMPYSVKEGKNGKLIENRNIIEFARAIDEISNDRDLRGIMNQYGMQYYKKANKHKDLKDAVIRDILTRENISTK